MFGGFESVFSFDFGAWSPLLLSKELNALPPSSTMADDEYEAYRTKKRDRKLCEERVLELKRDEQEGYLHCQPGGA